MSAVAAAEASNALSADPHMSPAAGAGADLRGHEVTVLPATLLEDVGTKIQSLLTDFEAATKRRSCLRIVAIVVAVVAFIFTIGSIITHLPIGIGVGIAGMACAGYLYYKNIQPSRTFMVTQALDTAALRRGEEVPLTTTVTTYDPFDVDPEIAGWRSFSNFLRDPARRPDLEAFLKERKVTRAAELPTDKVLQIWRKYQQYTILKESEAKSKAPLFAIPAACTATPARQAEVRAEQARRLAALVPRIAAQLATFDKEFVAEFHDYL